MIDTLSNSPWFQLGVALSMLGFSFGQYVQAAPVLTESNQPKQLEHQNQSEPKNVESVAPLPVRLNSKSDPCGKSISAQSDKPEKGTIETGWYDAKTRRYYEE